MCDSQFLSMSVAGVNTTMADYINTNMIKPGFGEYMVVDQAFPAGYNIYYLPTPTLYARGSIMWISCSGGTVAVDNLHPNNYMYSDMEWWSFVRLNTTENWAFYFKVITNSSSTPANSTTKQYTLSKTYSSTGTYQLSASLLCNTGSSVAAQQILTVTDGEFSSL